MHNKFHNEPITKEKADFSMQQNSIKNTNHMPLLRLPNHINFHLFHLISPKETQFCNDKEAPIIPCLLPLLIMRRDSTLTWSPTKSLLPYMATSTLIEGE